MKQHWHNFNKVRRSSIHPELLLQQHHQQEKKLPLSFNLLVWNIFKRHGEEQFDRDLLSLKNKTDLFCLQEVLFDQSPYLAEPFKQMSYNYGISYLRSDDFCEGVLTLSEYSPLPDAYNVLSLGREPITRTPKSALISLYALEDGRTLLVINLHMLLFKGKKKMQSELQQIMDYTAKYAHFPAIFSGDFNTFTAKQREQVDIQLALVGFDRCFPKHEAKGRRYLDHIYVRGMKTTHVEILDNITSSDHFPLFCELEVHASCSIK